MDLNTKIGKNMNDVTYTPCLR